MCCQQCDAAFQAINSIREKMRKRGKWQTQNERIRTVRMADHPNLFNLEGAIETMQTFGFDVVHGGGVNGGGAMRFRGTSFFDDFLPVLIKEQYA